MKRGCCFLVSLGLLAYWPALDAHPLMDDHLFFAWLEQTPWTQAVEHRLIGNWIPNFNQLQMYRPVSGVVQAFTYQLFGSHPLPQHLFSFFLHMLTSLLTGILTFRLSRDARAGWCAAAVLLLHPRAVTGVSLIFNFHDVLAASLMLGALLYLWSLKQQKGSYHRSKLLGLWLCTGLVLGVKEIALTFVAVLVLADSLWEETVPRLSHLLVRQAVPVVLLGTYLLARWKTVGHPFRTHHHPSAFPLPANAELWAILWDLLLLACSIAIAFWMHHLWRLGRNRNRQASWVVLWSGLALLPAVHFCSLVTLRPWYFDERYWYVPLVPLSVLAGLCLTCGGRVNAGLAAAILAFTIPGWLGVLMAFVTLVGLGALQFDRLHLDTQRMAAVLFASALALLALKQSQAIRLRANEAATVHQAVATAVGRTSAKSMLAFLNFNEISVEPQVSFNGDLQWLLQPPFFKEDLNSRLFFSYSRWDLPTSNRFRDLGTVETLTPNMTMGLPVNIYRWNKLGRTLDFIGEDSWPPNESTTHTPIEVVMRSSPGFFGRRVWRAEKLAVDPKIYRYASIKVIPTSPGGLDDKALVLRWASQPSAPVEQMTLPWPEAGWPTTRVTIWLHPGRYVDWLLGGTVRELVVEVPRNFDLGIVELSPVLPTEVSKAKHIDHYRDPATRFEWVGESWWVVGD